MRLLKRIGIIILFLLAIQYLHSQETTRLAELDALTGAWNVTAENRMSTNGPWETTKGTSLIKKTTGDALIEEEYSGTLNNKSFFTKSIIAYDHFNNVFQRVF